jgi:hypothetical protein
VHGNAFGRQDAVLPDVEPALTGQPVPNLDEAHLVIAIRGQKKISNLRRSSKGVERHKDKAGQTKQPDDVQPRFETRAHPRTCIFMFPGFCWISRLSSDHLSYRKQSRLWRKASRSMTQRLRCLLCSPSAPHFWRSFGRDVETTVVRPSCLNEAETLAACIDKAKAFLARTGIKGEVLISDNGSTDGSREIAEHHGARVVLAPRRGNGIALSTGIAAAKGHFVIMGDSDDSYDFSRLDGFVDALRGGADLVMGNRFRGGIEPGAMPVLHRYLGNPVLSFLGRVLYGAPVGDFQCGLRGFRRDKILALNLITEQLEFCPEMVMRAAMADLRIVEVPTTLKPDGRSRKPHLRTWHDGWRHLKLLLTFAPFSLFLYPAWLCWAWAGCYSCRFSLRPFNWAG